jgi:hypothetical protein
MHLSGVGYALLAEEVLRALGRNLDDKARQRLLDRAFADDVLISQPTSGIEIAKLLLAFLRRSGAEHEVDIKPGTAEAPSAGHLIHAMEKS